MSDKLHWSLGDSNAMVKRFLPEGISAAASTLPQDGFEPAADWENSYDVVYAGPQPLGKDDRLYYGSLRIGARFEKDRLNLKIRGIRQLQQDFRFERQHLQAECSCHRDHLFSLKEGAVWSLGNRLKNQRDPVTRPYAKIDESGRVRSGKIEKKNAAGEWYTYRTLDPGTPVVSDWALLAAVQVLPRDREFKFGYFAQLERFSPEHRIKFLETVRARFGDRDVSLHGYVQTGRGVTPYFYWVDDHGRLLFARFALAALVYSQNPRLEKEAKHDI